MARSLYTATVRCRGLTQSVGKNSLGATLFTGISIVATPTANATISVSEAHFEQVVEDPRISTNANPFTFDAVAGKSASFRVVLNGPTNVNTLPGAVIVNVMSGSTLLASSATIPLSQFDSTGTYTIMPYQIIGAGGKSFVPTTAGPIPLSIQVVPSTNATGVVAGPPYAAMSLNVHQVVTPNIGFVQLNSPTNTPCSVSNAPLCISSPDLSDSLKSLQSDKFVSASFPVPDGTYQWSQTQTVSSMPATAPNPNNPDAPLAVDLKNLENRRNKLGLDRLVAFVSQSYFDSHDPADIGITGLTLGYLNSTKIHKAVFALAGNPEVVPHELGHSFGQLAEKYTSLLNGIDYDGTPINGYDGVTGLSYVYPAAQQNINAISFMGPSDFRGGLNRDSTSYNYWADNDTYSILLNSITSGTYRDPATILVSGILSQTGQFSITESFDLPNGTITPSDSDGNLVIALVDQAGNVLSQVTQLTSFQFLVARNADAVGGPSTITSQYTPVVVQLPYNSAATSIQVSQNGKAIATTSLSAQLLSGIVASIPDNAFVEPFECRIGVLAKIFHSLCDNYVSIDRNLLSKKVAKIQEALNSKRSREAASLLDALEFDVRLITTKNYTVQDSSELTQSQVLAQLEGIEAGLPKNHNDEGRDNKEEHDK